MTHPAPAPASHQAGPLPFCIPLDWRHPTGAYMLAYPRTPYDARLWQVLNVSDVTLASDKLCTVDDFGDLVVTHQRNPRSLLGCDWQRVAA